MRVNRILSTALGVAAVLALAAPAFSSNMGFKLEREFAQVQDSRSLYFASIPFFRSVEDLAGPKGDERTPDGIVDANDVLMDWFTNGDGACPTEPGDNGNNFPDECDGVLTMFTFNPDPAANPNQTFTFQTIRLNLNGEPVFTQDNSFTIQDPTDPNSQGMPQQGYMVQAVDGAFPSVIVGSHNPDISTWVLPQFDPSRNLNIFSLPYHTTFTTSRELLDAIWDETEDPKENITMFTFDPDPATNQGQTFTTQTIRADLAGNPIFIPDSGLDCGDGFCLTPGNGYMIQVVDGGADGQLDVPLPHY